MPEIDLDGFQLCELEKLLAIAGKPGNPERRVAEVKLFLIHRDIHRAMAAKEEEQRRS